MPNRSRRGRGEGTITRLPSGSWRAEIYCGSDDSGKPIRFRKTFKLKSDAVAWLAEVRVKFRSGELSAPSTLTVADWLVQWLEIHKTAVETRSYEHDKFRVNRWLIPRIGPVKLADLRGLHLSKMLAELHAEDVTDSERQKAGAVLRKSINSAVAHGLLKASPLSAVKLPTPKRPEPRAWTPDECRAVIDAAARLFGYGPLFRLWIECGFRPGEMFGLRWEDFAWESGTVRISRNIEYGTQKVKDTKTRKSRRTLPIFGPTLDGLRNVRKESGYVLPNELGKPFTQSNFRRWKWMPIRSAAGVAWSTPYTFRHTSATILLRSGIPLKTVSDRLGHEDVTTTLRHYAHLIQGDSQHAADTIGATLLGVDAQTNTEDKTCSKSTSSDLPAPATD